MEGQLEVSKNLIECFNSVIDHNSVSKFEILLKTVRKNLTFDDPGMFNNSVVRDHQTLKIQDSTVLWLINQVVWALNEKKFYRSSDVLIDLQKTIIAASFLKQPAFCKKLVNKYVQLMSQLAEAPVQPTKPLVITLFCVDDFDMKTISKDCTFKPIHITSIQSQNNILLANVRLLMRAMTEITDLEKEMSTNCALCILDTLHSATLRIKAKCFQYFTKFFKHTISLDDQLQPIIVSILESVSSIENSIPTWLHYKKIKNEDVDAFAAAVADLLDSPHIFKLFAAEHLQNASKKCIQILQTHQTLAITACNRFVPSVLRFLKTTAIEMEILPCDIGEFVAATIKKSDAAFKKYIELLGLVVLEQAKDSHMQSWSLVDEKIKEIESVQNPSNEQALEQLKCIRSIFKTARFIEHNLTIDSQQNDCKKSVPSDDQVRLLQRLQEASSTIGEARFGRKLFPKLDALSSFVMKRFSMLLTSRYSPLIDTSTLLLFAEVAATILSVLDAQEIDDYTQSQLLLIALCPFVRSSELLFNHFQQGFEEAAPRITKIMESPFLRNTSSADSSSGSWQHLALKVLANINMEYITTKNKGIFLDLILQIASTVNQPEYLALVMDVLMNCVIHINNYNIQDLEKFMRTACKNSSNHSAVSSFLRDFYCLTSGQCSIFQTNKDGTFSNVVVCLQCQNHSCVLSNFVKKHNGKYLRALKTAYKMNYNNNLQYFELFKSDEATVRNNMTKCLPSILNHLDFNCLKAGADYWLTPIVDEHEMVRMGVAKYIHLIPKLEDEDVHRSCLKKLVECTKKFLVRGQKNDQATALQLILAFAISDEITEPMLLNCFRLTLTFCISSKSMVARQAALNANEMCIKFKISPKNLLIWYKTDLIKFIVSLCVSNYSEYKMGLQKSISAISQMFGHANEMDFISEHHGILLAMLIPWAMKNNKCIDMIEEICDTVQKDLPTVLCSSFLSIYPHLYLNETAEINNKSMQFIVQSTDNSLYHLLKSDTKRTIAEILAYYHQNADFVMKTFRSLLLDPGSGESPAEFSTKKLVEHLKTRFLGVICHFEQILIFDNEKSLKREILLSLGEIMRFMGSENITMFRFKLLAVLRTALTINQIDLKAECIQVWKIFIFTVDLVELGPLLSTIIVSLEPLAETHPEAVNDMLKYLIIVNGNLLSAHISDLFFIEQTEVSTEIKKHVLQYTNKNGAQFLDKFTAATRYINYDNVTVRIYALNYLTNLFENNRKALNQLIIGQHQTHTHIDDFLDMLMACAKSHDEKLQIAAGRCLGKLAAIEPSHLSPNYGPQQSFARSVNTDEFAITALAELCVAYQSQTDTKRVNGYSLAIQDILVARGVSPRENKNLKVWQAIPDRMHALVEPMLTSCYTAPHITNNIKIHPIFGNKSKTFEEWAVTWAAKAIDMVADDDIKSLLLSFKPCMRHDIQMLTLFLPYVLLHAIQTSTPADRQEITDEFSTVALFVIRPTNKSNAKNLYKTIKAVDFSVSTVGSERETVITNETTDTIGIKCAKLIFNQMDFIDRWVRSSSPSDKYYGIVKQFIEQFDKKVLATANFQCGEYARALMYLEAYIEQNKMERMQPELSFLFQIYAELMDPDSLEGAVNLKNTEPTLTEQIIKNNVQGRLQESTVCYERLMRVGGLMEHNAKDMIQCYMGLDQPETALVLAEGLMKEMYDQNVLMQSCAESLWRLGRFEELEEMIECSDFKESSEWGIRCGQILLDFRRNEKNLFAAEVDKTQLTILKDLRIVGDEQNCYQKGYSDIMKLHLISEIEQAHDVVTEVLDEKLTLFQCEKAMEKLFEDWEARLLLLQPTARIIEPILCLRRIVLCEVKKMIKDRHKDQDLVERLETKINSYIGSSWIKSIELANDDGMHQQAHLYILNAEPYKSSNLFIEKAKLLWKKGDQTNSLKVLDRGIKEICQATSTRPGDKVAHGEAKYLIAYYNAESMNKYAELNLRHFREASKVLSESEKAWVHYAQYMEKALAAKISSTPSDVFNQEIYDMQAETMKLYFQSMLHGSKHIYQSMPRVLSIWFDFTATQPPANFNKMQENYLKKTATIMNSVAKLYSEKLPPFMFITAFSQLVSRICHPSLEVYGVLKTIIVNLILAFPQQSLWMILSVYKSSYASRVRRCQEILSDPRLNRSEMQKLIKDFNSMAEKMIELTNKTLSENTRKFSIKQIYPQLPQILSNQSFSRILMPIQKFMLPVLPALHQRNEPATSYNAFPNQAVYIAGIKDELNVMPSLARPRRVTLTGSDGEKYIIMMKPKDDLRKDFRLMEFNSVVKRYLHENPDARQRRLNIRTYGVLPLNEECGIIEWISNLHAFRHILTSYYKPKRLGVTAIDTKEGQQIGKSSSMEKKRDFLNRMLAKCPPVFSEWFRERFTTPHNWYQARSAYIRTTAVMSIVGYILGLGDRHGENILFDAGTGDTIHVDFNCLFNRGEMFEVPEVVPFRLTRNMVHAMGPLGVEGSFRKCCEITMTVLQDQMPTLMSVLRPFVYDPLVSWSRNTKNDGQNERTDPQAMENVQHIEERLKGYVKIKGTNANMPLSIGGVVDHCIKEATDPEKLACMYVGWGAYL